MPFPARIADRRALEDFESPLQLPTGDSVVSSAGLCSSALAVAWKSEEFKRSPYHSRFCQAYNGLDTHDDKQQHRLAATASSLVQLRKDMNELLKLHEDRVRTRLDQLGEQQYDPLPPCAVVEGRNTPLAQDIHKYSQELVQCGHIAVDVASNDTHFQNHAVIQPGPDPQKSTPLQFTKNAEQDMEVTKKIGDWEPGEMKVVKYLSAKSRANLQSTIDVSEEYSGATLKTRQATESYALEDARSHWRKMAPKRAKRATTKLLEDKMKNICSSKNIEQRELITSRILRSRSYEMFSVLLIVANSSLIGWQIEYDAQHHQLMAAHVIAERAFCIAFFLELAFRAYALGTEGFFADWGWNFFDVFTVFASITEQVVELTMADDESLTINVSALRVLRVLRIVRVMRVVRLLTFFRELRMMLYSILGSAKALVWAILIQAMMFYMFGICLTQGVTDFLTSSKRGDASDVEVKDLFENFGSLGRSVYALFCAMAGGISWGELVTALRPLHWTYTAVFLLFICCAIFCVVNIVTGVFVESAMQNSQQDKDSVIQEEIRTKEEYVRSMHSIFTDMDEDGSGDIGLLEFQKAIVNERMVAYFNALGLDITDVETLFVLLDKDQTGSINMEEFLVGCMRLKGEARSLDLAKMSLESEWVVHAMTTLKDTIGQLEKKMNTFIDQQHAHV